MTLKNLRFLTDARWSIKISTKTWLLIIFYVGTYAKNKKYQVPVSARLVYPNLFNDSHDKSVSQYTCARYLKIHEIVNLDAHVPRVLSYRVLSYIGNSCRSPYNEATVYLPRAILFIPHSVPARSRRRLYDCFDFQALLLVRRLMFLFSPCIRWERIVTFSNAQIASEEIRRV